MIIIIIMQEEHPLQVARCTKIISPNTDDAKYVINIKQIAKFVVGLGEKVAPTDIEEGMRVGYVSSSSVAITIRFCVSTRHSSFTFLIHRYNVVRVGLPLRAAVSSAKSIRFKFPCHPKSIRPSP